MEKHLRKINPEAERAIEKAKNYTHIKRLGTDFRKWREEYKRYRDKTITIKHGLSLEKYT